MVPASVVVAGRTLDRAGCRVVHRPGHFAAGEVQRLVVGRRVSRDAAVAAETDHLAAGGGRPEPGFDAHAVVGVHLLRGDGTSVRVSVELRGGVRIARDRTGNPAADARAGRRVDRIDRSEFLRRVPDGSGEVVHGRTARLPQPVIEGRAVIRDCLGIGAVSASGRRCLAHRVRPGDVAVWIRRADPIGVIAPRAQAGVHPVDRRLVPEP